jgi:hypothetical protein
MTAKAGRPRGPLVVFRMGTEPRYAHLAGFVGARVRLTVNGLRNLKAELYDVDPERFGGAVPPTATRARFYAKVITVATTNVGTVDHVLVVQVETGRGRYSAPLALSGATIEAIERAA